VTRVEANGAYMIRGAGCALAALTGKHPAVCLAMESLVAEVVGVDVNECCDRTERRNVVSKRLGSRPNARGDSGVRAVRHGFEQIRRGPIAFARRGFEVFAVNDGDAAVSVFDQPGFLQRSSDDADRWSARAEHHCDKFLRERKFIRLHPIVCHKQPTRQSLLDRMDSVACRRLGNESEQRLRVVGQHFVECATPIGLSTEGLDLHESAGRQTDNVLTLPSLEPPAVGAIGSGVTENDIAGRALERHCDRGREGRLERRRIPACPQCDATDAERVLAAAPQSRLRWFRCRGCGHLWNVAPPISSLP